MSSVGATYDCLVNIVFTECGAASLIIFAQINVILRTTTTKKRTRISNRLKHFDYYVVWLCFDRRVRLKRHTTPIFFLAGYKSNICAYRNYVPLFDSQWLCNSLALCNHLLWLEITLRFFSGGNWPNSNILFAWFVIVWIFYSFSLGSVFSSSSALVHSVAEFFVLSSSNQYAFCFYVDFYWSIRIPCSECEKQQ